jgi:hypothetical protein
MPQGHSGTVYFGGSLIFSEEKIQKMFCHKVTKAQSFS